MQGSNGGNKEEDKVPEGAGELLRVAVIGTGKMGRCLAGILKGRADVTICSRSLSKARSTARRLRVRWAGIDAVTSSDVVIAAMPTEALPDFARNASRQMRPGAVFVDVSSVKLGLIEGVEGTLPEGVGYVSLHPLFTSPRVKERSTAVIPVRRTPTAERFIRLLLDSGMSLFETTAEEHDRATAATQVLHHFALLAMKSALDKMSKTNPIAIESFTTHSLRKTQAVLRLVERNHGAVITIQKLNRYGKEARREFLKEAFRIDEEFG